MFMQTQREQVAEFGRKMLEKGLTRNTGGYLSIIDREAGGVAVCPSGMEYMLIQPEDVVIMDLEGNKLDGSRRPSTEWPVIRTVFANRPDINALVHTHSPSATVMSALRWELPVVNFTISLAGGPVRCTDFYNYTTQDLADAILEKMQDRYAVLMGNHGLLAAGVTMKQAFTLAEEIEFGCEVYLRAKSVGNPVSLTDAQMLDMQRELGGYYSK